MPKKQVFVVPLPNGDWGVRQENAERLSRRTTTQANAIEIGKEIARNQQAELTILGKDGKIRSKDSYGNDPVPPKDEEH